MEKLPINEKPQISYENMLPMEILKKNKFTPLERILNLGAKAKSIDEKISKNLKNVHHQYVELLIEQKLHMKWLELGEYMKNELRKVIYNDHRVQTYFNAIKSNTMVKDAISKKIDEIEQLRKKIKDEKFLSEDEILMVDAEILSIDSNINMTPIEELQELEKVIEKTQISCKEEFWNYFSGNIKENFLLSSSDIAQPETPMSFFEEETKDFVKQSPIKTSIQQAEKIPKSDFIGSCELVDTALKIKNNKLFEKIREEIHSDYGQFINSIEFENCCIDCEEAIKIGQLFSEKEYFGLKFTNTQGSINVLLASVGPKLTISELSIVNSSLQPIIIWLQSQQQRVKSILLENIGIMDGNLIGVLIDSVAKNSMGRTLIFKGIDFNLIPVMLLKNAGCLKELHFVKCNLCEFGKLAEILENGKTMETLEFRSCLENKISNYEMLAKLISINYIITTLNISENEITPECLKPLAKCMSGIKSLQTIIMDHCTYQKEKQNEIEEVLFEIIKSGKSLKTLSLKGFMLNDDAKAMALLDKWAQQDSNIKNRVELF